MPAPLPLGFHKNKTAQVINKEPGRSYSPISFRPQIRYRIGGKIKNRTKGYRNTSITPTKMKIGVKSIYIKMAYLLAPLLPIVPVKN